MTNADEDLTRRAFAAYFRNPAPGVPDAMPLQPSNTSGVVTHDGLTYIELHNGSGTLAVYRLLNNGRLKRLRRWPEAIDADHR